MKSIQHVRGSADLRTLRVARVRSALTLGRQQHFLDAHFLSLKASRLESMLAELDRRRDRVIGQLRETRELLEHVLADQRADQLADQRADQLADQRADQRARPPSTRTMPIDY